MSPREKRLALVTAAVVGAYLLWVVAAAPLLDDLARLDEQAGVTEQALERDRALRERLGVLKDERDALEAALRPPAGEGVVPWFLDHVRDLSRASGFEPTSLRYVRAEPLGEADGPFAELRFELRASVGLDDLQPFLIRLAASERPVRVVSLSVSPRPGGDGEALEVALGLSALAPREVLEERGS